MFRKRVAAALAASLMVLLTGSGAARAADGAPAKVTDKEATDYLRKLQDALKLLDKSKPKDCWSALERLDADPRMAAMPEGVQHVRLIALGLCGYGSERYREAHDALVKSTAAPNALGEEWLYRMFSAGQLNDDDDASLSLSEVANHYPEQLASITESYVLSLRFGFSALPNGLERRFWLDEGLVANWKPTDPFTDLNDLYADHATDLLARGQPVRAAALAMKVTTVSALAAMRADRRFDPITTAAPDHFDLEKAAAALVVQATADAAKYPARLEAVNRLGAALLAVDRPAEALPLLDDALARTAPGAKPTRARPAFTDKDDQLNWTLDLRSQLLFALGRADEALAAMKAAATQKEGGQVNVSQTLNLADADYATGHAKEALDTLAPVDNVSAYGRSVKLVVGVCAKTELGDAAGAKADLKALEALKLDDHANLQFGRFCAGDLDGAAAILIARLKDPLERGQALRELQTLAPADHLGPTALEQKRINAALLPRPDVQAAVAAVGRIERFRLRSL